MAIGTRPRLAPRRTVSHLLALALGASLVLAGLALADGRVTRIDLDGSSPAAERLRAAVEEVSAGDVQVLVPDSLRFLRNPKLKRRTFATARVRRNGWSISLDATRECGGAEACSVGSLFASRDGLPDDAGFEPVELADGRPGAFRGVSCGGSCAPANIAWRSFRHLYVLQINAPPGDLGSERERRVMIKMANEAIAAGPR